MEDLDSLLTSGNIPDLFEPDEIDAILMELKTDALLAGLGEDRAELSRFLISVIY